MQPLRGSSIIYQMLLTTLYITTVGAVPCRNICGGVSVNYPFGVDDGCGAPEYRKMLNCSNDLFFLTPSGNYRVRSIDYDKKTMVIYDPAMSTCTMLQPHHDLVMSEIQSVIIPPSEDTVFILLNCSIDSPVLNHYRSLCFNFSGHSCEELYNTCTAFRIFHLLSGGGYPGCCFTAYNTVKLASMNILDCSHYTTVYNTDDLKGIGPLDWSYGMRLSYTVPNTGCDRCEGSGGTCGFDTETEGPLCLCSTTVNSTRECAAGSGTATRRGGTAAAAERRKSTLFQALVSFVLGALLEMIL